MKAGTRLWRSQAGYVQGKLPITDNAGKQIRCIDYPVPLVSERMKPLTDRAYEGRVNPKGIPCLYLSNDMNTSMTEVRPWIGSYVSVSEFEINTDLLLVDCSLDSKMPLITTPKGTPAERERMVWWMINFAFSQPVTRSDDTADYAPTQVIAEAFRQDGCDGLIYGSQLGTGRNIAVFDLKAATETVSRHLYRVDNVKLEFTDCTAHD